LGQLDYRTTSPRSRRRKGEEASDQVEIEQLTERGGDPNPVTVAATGKVRTTTPPGTIPIDHEHPQVYRCRIAGFLPSLPFQQQAK
jgi:hypothetical protein